MINELLSHLKFLKVTFKVKMLSLISYRYDYLLWISVQVINIFVQLLFLDVTVGNIRKINGWDYWLIIAIYGFFQMVVSIYQMFFQYIVMIPEELAFDGGLDLYFTKPFSILFQITFGNLDLSYLPSFIIGFIIFIYGAENNITLTSFVFWLKFLVALISAVVILVSIYLIFCSIAFWVNDRLSIQIPLNQLIQLGKYPTTIYNSKLSFILTWIFPLAFVAFMPTLFIFEVDILSNIYLSLPFVALVLLIVSSLVWRKGLKKYSSVS